MTPTVALFLNLHVYRSGHIDEPETESVRSALSAELGRRGVRLMVADDTDVARTAREVQPRAIVIGGQTRAWLAALTRTIGYRPALLVSLHASSFWNATEIVEHAGFDGWVPLSDMTSAALVTVAWVEHGAPTVQVGELLERIRAQAVQPAKARPAPQVVSKFDMLDALEWRALREVEESDRFWAAYRRISKSVEEGLWTLDRSFSECALELPEIERTFFFFVLLRNCVHSRRDYEQLLVGPAAVCHAIDEALERIGLDAAPARLANTLEMRGRRGWKKAVQQARAAHVASIAHAEAAASTYLASHWDELELSPIQDAS